MALPETGWTALPTVAPPKKWYVSVTDGNDANSGLSPAAPKKTLESLDGLTAAGEWLLLDERDTWDQSIGTYEQLTFAIKSGISAARPFVISSYGAGARLPVIRPYNDGFTGAGLDFNGKSNILIRNIDFYGDYDGTGGAVYGISVQGTAVDDIRIEGCLFRNLFEGIRIDNGTPHGAVVAHRCGFSRLYVNAAGTHPNGCYFDKVDATLSECFFDYGGWNPDGGVNAKRTIFRRAIYFQFNSTDSKLLRTVILRSGSEGAQMRIGGRVACVVCAECSGAGFTHNAGQGAPSGDEVRFFAQLGSADIDVSTPRGGGIEIENGSGYYGGLILSGRNLPMGGDCNGIVLKNTATPEIDRATVIDWQSSGGTGRSIVCYSGTPTLYLHDSDVQSTGATTTLVDTRSLATGTLSSTSDRNRYKGGSSSIVFYGPEGSLPFATWQKLRVPAEAVSAYGAVAYPRADSLSIAAYMASIGGTASLDGFAAGALANRYGAWDERYTAGALYNYLAESVGRKGALQLPPGNLRAAIVGSNAVLNWGEPSDYEPLNGYGVASYKVWKSTNDGSTWAVVGTPSTPTLVVAASEGDLFAVSAVDTDGHETQTGPATTASVPANPPPDLTNIRDDRKRHGRHRISN